MNKLYKFLLDYGRHGKVEGLFVAKEKDVQECYGVDISMGEILGKHSEVEFVLNESMLQCLDVDEKVTEELLREFGSDIIGYNPLKYISEFCEKCGEEKKYCECEE